MRKPQLSIDGYRLLDRRRFLVDAAGGLSALALSSLLFSEGVLADSISQNGAGNPLHARSPHFTPRAKQVLMIFCSGACSQLDTWDYKPELIAHHDQPMPGNVELVSFQSVSGNLARSPYAFRPRGECGKWTSDLLPRLGDMVDEMCFIHSMTAKSNTHGPGENQMSTGFTLDGFPSIGAWTTYALGSETQDLPAFVAIPDPRGVPQAGPNNWSNGFLPAVFQGTAFSANRPIDNLARPEAVSLATDNATRAFVRSLNERHLDSFPGDSELTARIASYEMAARLQTSAAEVADLSRESSSTLNQYGIRDPNPLTAGFGRNCLLARRLLERGVRFVQLFNGSYAMGEGVGNWDGHKQLKADYDRHGPVLDQPAAALLADLKARGMLEDVLVVWCTEFGRMPVFQKGAQGRDHNPDGFTVWLAGAGVKAPFSYGATDDFGHRAVEKVTTIYDLHATILHLLGLDHTMLTFTHNGSDRRLTDVHGEVIEEILLHA
ncbi:DUF1501 domain-containing protein [Aeoliella sp. ICT_H6.2]|uniref:DUF1501 domain-containing protein n=1 Tax=Aeoliella straminimaris TaxID=2954799 RepID=A0A9X2F835_9BACT|nr:DUF1501 domain-containing protein [Aeoliella straminimaris]